MIGRAEPDETAAGRRRAVGGALCWLGFAIAALLLGWRRQPAHLAAGEFSSDTAIPLLMANADALTPFHLFYFGQDRFGGWPYILAWVAGRAGGFGWTPELLYGFQALVVFSAVWPASRLGGAWGGLVAAAYLLVVGLDPACLALDVAQPYGWQLSTFLWAWWALRRACEERGRGASGRRMAGVAAVAGALSGWLSPFSYLALLLAGAVEATRAWLGSGPAARPSPRRFVLFAAAPALAAMGFGLLAMLGHLAYAYARGFRFQHTAMRLDVRHLGENLVGMAGAALRLTWWPIAPLATLGAVAVAWRLFARWRAGGSLAEGPGSAGVPPAEGRLGALELEATALGAWLVGTANFALFVLISWARINDYHPRYLTLSQVPWAVAAAAAALSFAGGRLRAPPRLAASVPCALAVAALAGAAARSAPPSPSLHPARAAARALAGSRTHTVLFGDYWGTYLFAGVEPRTGIVPVVSERSLDRMPWESRKLGSAERVVVSHWRFPRSGDAQRPAPWLFERDTLLVHAGPFLTSGPHGFSAYDNRTPASGAGVGLRLGGEAVGEAATDGKSGTVAEVAGWREGAAPLEVRFPRRSAGRVLLFFDKAEAPAPLVPEVRAAWTAATVPAAQTARGRDFLVVEFSGSGSVDSVSLERLDGKSADPVRLREVFVLPERGAPPREEAAD